MGKGLEEPREEHLECSAGKEEPERDSWNVQLKSLR